MGGAGLNVGPVVFIGDSITFSWPDLQGPGRVNCGIPGETTADMRARFPRQVAEAGASGTHILGGVNDIAGNGGAISLDETRSNLRRMAEIGLTLGLQVWIGSVTPAERIWWTPSLAEVAERIITLNDGIEADARALGVAFIDYHGPLADNRGGLQARFGEDGVHLSIAGYAVMTRIARTAVSRAWPVDSAGL